MSLTADSILQQNTGSFNAASGSATLGAGTAAGSAVVVCAAILGDAVSDWQLDPPAGFIQASGDDQQVALSANKVYVFLKKNTSAESSWSLITRKDSASGSAREVVWAAFEVVGTGLDRLGADLGGTFPTSAGIYQAQWGLVNTGNMTSGTETAVASRATGVTDDSSCYGTLSFAAVAATAPSTTPTAITGHTNGFTEIASVNRVGSTRAITLSVAVKAAQVLDPQSTTVALSPSSAVYTAVVSLFADGAKHAPDLAAFTGFGFATATGIATGSGALVGTAPFDTVVGTPAIVTTNPRSGAYCLELSSTAAAECLTWASDGVTGFVLKFAPPTQNYLFTARIHVYFPSSLPGADVELFSCEAGSLANGMVCWYRSASQKLGMVVGTGTEVLSDAVVTVDKWIGVDWRWDPRYTNHLVDWQVDYDATPGDATAPVAQTQAVGASTSIANPTIFRLGWTTAKTATVRYADVGVSKMWGPYPVGDLRTTVVGPDQAGTPTISGTATNFKTYTGGPAGTLSTWSAATTRSALNEIPPSVGTSVGTGLTQVTAASADYCEIPMDTFTAAPNYVLRAVRWYAAARAASTAAATVGMQFWDSGAAMVDEIIVLNHLLDPATPRWFVKMHSTKAAFYQITQPRMDGLRARFGYSTDATPDVALDALFCEVAYQPAVVIGVLGAEDGAFMVYARQDGSSGAVASYLVTTPPGTRGATFYYSLLGVDQTPVYVNPNTTYEQVTAGVDISTVTGVGLSPDAQPEV
jgi:hypothetical protein